MHKPVAWTLLAPIFFCTKQLCSNKVPCCNLLMKPTTVLTPPETAGSGGRQDCGQSQLLADNFEIVGPVVPGTRLYEHKVVGADNLAMWYNSDGVCGND